MKLDILAFAAHPDDTELACSGTLALHVSKGDKVGVIDFTEGEMGTRGTPELRLQEAQESAKILNLSVRENLGFEDVYFKNDRSHQLKVVQKIRQYQPTIIIANAISDRHPDHGRAAEVVKSAFFLAGLQKFETVDPLTNEPQNIWRPKRLLHYIQSIPLQPDFVVDITAHWDTKMKAIMAFASQFYDPNSKEPDTYISDPKFMKMIEARSLELGQVIGTNYAEGFMVDRYLGLKDLDGIV
jgi:bacillithiol biosynthesis deacetylase BshB1